VVLGADWLVVARGGRVVADPAGRAGGANRLCAEQVSCCFSAFGMSMTRPALFLARLRDSFLNE